MKARIRSATVLAAIAALLTSTGAASAHDPGTNRSDVQSSAHEHREDEGVTLEGREESLQAVAGLLARSAGGSVEDARHVLVHQERADEIQEILFSEFPESYGGAFSEGFPTIRTTILVKGGATREIRESLGVLGDDIVLSDTEYSMADRERIADAVHKSLLDQGFTEVTTGIDVNAGTIRAEVRSDGLSDTQAVSRRAATASMAATGLRVDDAMVDVSTIRGSLFTDDTFYGGDWLRDDGVNECTSGFTATRNGTTGVLTAGHCAGLNQYKHTWNGTHTMSYVNGHVGIWGDFEFRNVNNGSLRDDFYFTSSNRMDVASVQGYSGIDINDWVCRYGRQSNWAGCVQINATYVSMTVDGVTASNLIRTNMSFSEGGDSGGPWYTTNRAWGLNKGRFSSNQDGAFSLGYLAESTLGLTINR